MKKLALYVLLFAFLGCEKAPVKPVLVTINNYSISREEFDREFIDSPLAKKDTREARKQFLEMLINRKLLLQEAQKLGLDKDAEFLKSIERFWEQSLLKAYLDRKTQEVAGQIFISDFAVEQAYKNLQAEGKADKPYAQMYRTLKWDLARAKESELMDKWLKDLKNNAAINVNVGLLKEN
jgi:peptidyl-prolyl cis-trans isomerase SurA